MQITLDKYSAICYIKFGGIKMKKTFAKNFCHSELTRKLVELAKRNFLFLLGVSESNSKQMLKQVQHDNFNVL